MNDASIPHALTPPGQFDAACRSLGLELSDDERAALGRYLHLLLETNKRFNLTAIREPGEAWMRHILDSLTLLPQLPAAEQADAADDPPRPEMTLIDVGTGGGLPGIVLAIVLADWRVTLLEATGKKARFCEQAAGALGLGNVTVVNDRAEAAGRQREHRQRYAIAVARAVGPMRVMLEYTLPLVRVGGRVLAMKGQRVTDELDEAGDALMTLGGGNVELYDAWPDSDWGGAIVSIEKVAATPKAYPRRPGEPKANPL